MSKLKKPDKFTWTGGDLTWAEEPGESIDIHADTSDE